MKELFYILYKNSIYRVFKINLALFLKLKKVLKTMLNVEFKSDEVSDFHLKISQNIKRIRKQAGITQLNLAVGIGINSSGSYSDYENYKNSKKFNLDHLYKIAKVLEVDVCEFFI